MTTAPAACFLGIDAGGSKTAWVVMCGDDCVEAGLAESIQVGAVGVEAAAAGLAAVSAAASTRAPGPIAGAVAGLAGAGSTPVRSALRRALDATGIAVPLRLAGDIEVAAAAALSDDPGVALWSGTGSFAVARDTAGGLHRVGGRGWLLGDQGSAFDLARRGAAAVVAAQDQLGEATSLVTALTEAAGCSLPVDLGRCLQSWPPRAVAALYPVVRAAAERGDREAIAIQEDGAAALAALAIAAARRADLPLGSLRVVLGGGVLQHDPGLRQLVQRALVAAGVQAPAQLGVHSPARGAAVLARACARNLAPLCRWIGADDLHDRPAP